MVPTVSVIMPAFNIAEYIGESIRSVCRQTFEKWELIIIDDGSVDATGEVARLFLDNEPRIRYYKQDNQGVAAVRNRGILLARGEYIAFLDSDDLWDPFFLEKAIAVHEECQADCVCGYSNRLLPDGTIWEYPFKKERLSGNILIPWIRRHIIIHINAMVLKKQVILENGISFTTGCLIGEDTEFKCKIFSICNVHCLPEVLMTYRQRAGSVTEQSWNWGKYMHSINAFGRAVTFVEDHYRGPDYQNVILECQKQFDLRKYEFLYKMIRYGYFQELKNLLIDPVWRRPVDRVSKGEFGLHRRLRAWLILAEQEWLWRWKRWR